MNLTSVLRHQGVLLGGFLALATLSVMNSAYSLVLDAIKAEMSLSYSQAGALMSAYFTGYAIGQIPWGLLADKYGSRFTVALSVLGVSMSTILFGLSQGVEAALASRFISGLLGAGVFVPCVRLVSGWFRSDERGTALGILNIGGESRANCCCLGGSYPHSILRLEVVINGSGCRRDRSFSRGLARDW